MKKRTAAFCLLFLFLSFYSHAESFSVLLELYLKNDSEIEKLRIEAEKAEIALKKFEIQKGINFSAGTGDGTLYLENSELAAEMTPSASVSVPDARNTEIKVEVPMEINSSSTNTGVEATLSGDILPAKKITETKVERLSLERALLEAQRSYAAGRSEAEKEFLNSLRTLFTQMSDALESQDDYNTANEEFELVKAQGYLSSSVEYRNKDLKRRSALREYDEKIRVFKVGLEQLGNDCGTELQELPSDIPSVDLLVMSDFDLAKYKEYETALWQQHYNALERESTEPSFKLNGTLGYAYGDLGTNSYLDEKGHSILTGVGMDWKSISADVGLTVPVSDPDKTSLTFSVTWTPNQSKIDKLDLMTNHLSAETEKIAVSDALKNYSDKIDEMNTLYKDLLWKTTQYEEEEVLYYEMFLEYEKWYEADVATKLEFDQSKTDYETAKIANSGAKLDRLIYNMDVINLFISE